MCHHLRINHLWKQYQAGVITLEQLHRGIKKEINLMGSKTLGLAVPDWGAHHIRVFQNRSDKEGILLFCLRVIYGVREYFTSSITNRRHVPARS